MATSTSWLWAAKVTPPQRAPFHLDRKNLLKEAENSHWNVVNLTAPGGFGKTTLLAELCRRARRRNEVAGWLTVDVDDTAETIGLYMAFALKQAGFAIAESSSGPVDHLIRVAEAIENDGRPCLFVIDELESLKGAAVASLNNLLQRTPSNLRLMFGMRRNPGLDLSMFLLDGRVLEYGPDRLRFSRAEISAYFDDALSHRELVKLAESTHGWAVALGLIRHGQTTQRHLTPVDDGGGSHGGDQGVAANWLAHRLFHYVSAKDYEFLLEFAQFDWIEPSVVDEVLNRTDSARRLAGLEWLGGLTQPVDRKRDAMRLHPLIKAHCEEALKRIDFDRYRELHGAIGMAMFRREQVASAARHADKAGNIALLADILLGAGGLGLLIQEGMARFGNTLELLTEPVTQRFPRLAMLRCRDLVFQSKLTEALALFEHTRMHTADFTRDPAGGDERLLRYESSYIRGILVGFGALPFNSEVVDELVTTSVSLSGDDGVHPALAAGHAVLTFGAYQSIGMFEHAGPYLEEAQASFERIESPHGRFHVHLNLGMVALARGRASEAEQHYESAAGIVERHLHGDRKLGQLADVLLGELHLECNRLRPLRQLAPLIPVPFRNGAAWFDIIAAAHEVIVEWKFETGGADAALRTLDVLQGSTRSRKLAAASRHLRALRIGHLAMDGRVDDAQRHWVEGRLPERDEDLLRLQVQGMAWREAEALVCARLRLLTALGLTRPARRLSRHFLALAQQQGLVRSWMRCIALSIVLEHTAGDSQAAAAHLLDYLRQMSVTGFARPMVREAVVGRVLLEVLEGARMGPETRGTAEALRRHLAERREPSVPEFNRREREILELLGQGLRDKEIARELSLSAHGVRYHLKNIYRKTGAAGRAEAVNWAVSRGVLR